MSATHTVTAEADPDDGTPSWFRLTFTCAGGPGDMCHQWCAEGCEEQCSGDDIILAGSSVDLWRSTGAHRWEPMPPHGESCRIVDWLDAGDADESYADDFRDEPLRSGTHRIEEEWDGETYLWRYAEPAPAVASAS